MSLGQRIRSGAVWLFVGNAGSQIIGFLLGIVLARLLVPEDFGMLITLQVFTGLAGFVAGGGMGQALVRAKEVSKQDYDIVFTLQLIMGSLIYAGFFFSAPWFAEWYAQPIYADLLRVSALSFIFRPFVNLPGSILHRNMRFKAQTVVKVTTLLLTNGVCIAMAYLGYGVWSLIMGGIAGSVATMLMLIPMSKWRPGFSIDLRRGRDIARYGMLVTVTGILLHLQRQVSVFILSRTLGPASVGLYNKGESLAKMPHGFITGSVYHVLFRALAVEHDDLDKCRYLFFRSIALVAVYATPFYVGLLWLAQPLIRGVYGPNWVEAAVPLYILAFAWPFWLLNNLSGAVLSAKNWLDREVPVQAATLVISGLAVFIGLAYGIAGVAYAMVGVAIYSALHMYWLAVRCLDARLSSFFAAIRPAMLLNAILAGTLYLLDFALPASVFTHDFLYLTVMGVIGGCVYAAAFLWIPIPALAAEQQRWKSRLHFWGRLAPR